MTVFFKVEAGTGFCGTALLSSICSFSLSKNDRASPLERDCWELLLEGGDSLLVTAIAFVCTSPLLGWLLVAPGLWWSARRRI